MTAILDVALPFFAVIAAGYACLRLGWLAPASVAGLNSFVFHVALPALLVAKVAAAPVERLLDWRFVVVFYGTSALIYAAFLIGAVALGGRPGEASLRALAAIFTNSGYMGIPLLLAAIGPDAAIVAVLALLLDNIVATPLTMVILEAGRGGGAGAAALRRAFTSLARNPLMIAILLGMALAITDVRLPGPVAGFLNLVGAAASPCALFALGAALVGVRLGAGRRDLALVAGAKIALNPLLVWIGATWLLPLDPETTRAAILTAALPTAASVFVLAQRYESYVVRASSAVLVTHILSVVTLSTLLALLIE